MRRHLGSIASAGLAVIAFALSFIGVPRVAAFLLLGLGAFLLLASGLFWIGDRRGSSVTGQPPRSVLDELRDFQRRGLEMQHIYCLHVAGRNLAGFEQEGGGGEQMGRWIVDVRKYIDAHLPEHHLATDTLHQGRFVMPNSREELCAQMTRDLEALREVIRALRAE